MTSLSRTRKRLLFAPLFLLLLLSLSVSDLARGSGTAHAAFWGFISSGGQRLYATTPNFANIMQYDNQSWTTTALSGMSPIAFYSGGYGTFAIDSFSKDIWRYGGTPGSWTDIGGPGEEFAVSNTALYALAPDRSYVAQYSGSGRNWFRIGGPADDIYAGGYGLLATAQGSGDVYLYTAGQWLDIGGPGYKFAVTNTAIYALAPDSSYVAQYSGSGRNWITIGGPASTIGAGAYGLFALDQNDGSIHRYDETSRNWTTIGGPGFEFVVTSTALYGLAPDKSAVFQYTGSGRNWFQIGGPAGLLG